MTGSKDRMRKLQHYGNAKFVSIPRRWLSRAEKQKGALIGFYYDDSTVEKIVYYPVFNGDFTKPKPSRETMQHNVQELKEIDREESTSDVHVVTPEQLQAWKEQRKKEEAPFYKGY